MSKAQAKGKKQVVESDSEEEEEVVVKKQKVTNTKANTKAPAKPVKKVESDDEESEEEEVVKPTKQGKAAQKAAQKPKKVVESDEESEEEEEKPQAKKPAAKTNGKAQPKKQESEDEEEEEEEVPVKTVQPQQKQAAEAKGDKTQAHEVIVKGLPFSASDNDVKEYFNECGSIERVNVLKGHDGRSKGIAFITFADDSGVQTAISYTGSDFGGRSINVEKTAPREQRAPTPAREFQKSERDPTSTSIFVGNLSYQTTEDSLRRFFEACGKVSGVRVAHDQEGNPRGFAHVDFASGDSVEKAVAKAGSNLDGRPIRVDYSSGKKQDGGNRGGQRGGYGGRQQRW